MSSVRLGVIGCGIMGKIHLDAAVASPLLEPVAVADVCKDAATNLAEQFGITSVYSDANDLIRDKNVDAVILALPTCYRTELTLTAFAAGKHVLTEKPIAMNTAQVKQMIQARGNLVAACCSSRYQFLNSTRSATKFVATGKLGQLRVIRCRVMRAANPRPDKAPPPWRLSTALNGGGIFVNWGCYDLDYLMGIIGWSLKPRTVLAQTWPVPEQLASYLPPGSDAETHIATIVRCDAGPVIMYERSEYTAQHSQDDWQIIGSTGSLHMKMTGMQDKQIVYEYTSEDQGIASEVIWQGDEEESAVHMGPAHDFAEAIVHNRPPQTTLERSLILQQIVDAAYASAQQGRAVEIE